MRNIALLVSYDGTAYHGWQCQPNAVSVQEILQKAIERIVNEPVKLYAGARTDSGVHAKGQVVNFRSVSSIGLESLARALNSIMPRDIRVTEARRVSEDFHSRYSAKSKVYSYTILNTPHDSPFYGRFSWHVPYRIDVPSMEDTVGLIEGTHDFSSFKKKDEVYRSTVREIIMAGVRRRGNFIYVVLEGTGFLRYMVRNIVGTLILVGRGKLTKEGFRDILDSGDRQKAGPTAPAKGLVLRRIRY